MSYGWKHLNFNTADPWLLSQIVGDYLTIGDHETLMSMGFTRSLINELEEGTPLFDNWWTYDPERQQRANDLITSGRIDPPSDLNIPGDLWKWQFWNIGDVPDEQYYGGNGQGRRTWINERLRSGIGQNTSSNTFVHPSLTKFETAPSVNRLLSLFNAYGGDRSYILTSLMGFSNRGGGGGLFLLTDRQLGAAPELANYPIPYGIPFGQSSGNNFYYNWMMRNAYSGIYSGFEYAKMRSIWAEGRSPYSGQDLNPSTGELYGSPEVIHDWGVPGKIQVPTYYRKFQGGRQPSACHYEIRYFWDIAPTGLGYASSYSSGEEFRYALGRQEEPTGVAVQLPSGLITEDQGFAGEVVPFLEWPDVWDGSVFRPGKCPITRLTVFGEREPYIEFIKEVSEHVTAINEWFNDGCPCDWPEYGGYVDPVVQAEAEAAEKAAVSAATQYVPTSTTSATPPLNPKFGDLWRDSNTGKTKTFVQTSPTTGTWADA